MKKKRLRQRATCEVRLQLFCMHAKVVRRLLARPLSLYMYRY